MSAMKQLNSLVVLALILVCAEARAEECTELAKGYPGYVSAMGTGATVEVARSNALSALLLRLGSNVSLSETTSANQFRTSLDSDLKVNSSLKTDGLEVLGLCTIDKTYQTVLGIPIHLIAEQIKARAKIRLTKVEEWIKSLRYLNTQLTTLRIDEEKDRRLWLVMGKSMQGFPALGEEKWVELAAIEPFELTITVDSKDPIAVGTLEAAKRMVPKIKIPIVSESLKWGCSIYPGAETYGYQRSTTTCQLSDKHQAVICITAESVSTTERGNSSAVTAIKNEISRFLKQPGGR